jgi:hypothetical protein
MTKKLSFLLCLALALGLAGSQAYGLTLDIRLTDGNDDAEEHLADGSMDITSTDLEFPYEDNGNPSATDLQLNAMRFVLPLAKGTQISNAYLEFEQDETKGNDKPVNVIIEAQLVPDAPAIAGAAQDLSSRTPWTTAKVKWTVPMGIQNDAKVQSPDLTAILTEIVNQDGWASGNAVLLTIRDDPDAPSTGLRCMESVEGEATAAPLLHVEAISPEAKNPDPADGATGVTMPMLQWTPGDSAVSHNIYFGTSPELGAADLAMLGQPVALYFHALGIEPGVTYYWRVDEVDAAGVVCTGTVWSFTALPLTASAPQPADDANDLLPSQILSWSAGQNAAQHQVFFSSNKFDVILGAAAADKGTTAETKLDPGALTLGTVYYWRVDEIQADGTVLVGPAWSFTTADALDLRLTDGNDDAEEHLADGSMDITSTDLEFPYEDNGNPSATDLQLNAMRFVLPLAKGTQISNAYLEFEQDETKGNDKPVNVIIEAQLVPDAPAIAGAAQDLSSRTPWTTAKVKWTVPMGIQNDAKVQSPDLTAILTEIVNQDGWASGNAVLLTIRDDPDAPSTGLRCMESVEGEATAAPLLHVEAAGGQAAAPKATIIWVSDAYDENPDGLPDDQGWIDFLSAQGYNVDYRMGPAPGNGFWRTLDQSKIDALNAADLVIVSRNLNSGDYNNGNERDQWNGVTTPLIGLAMHPLRSSHWKWFNTTTINTAVPMMQPVDVNSPIFKDITRDANGQISVLGPTMGSSFPGTQSAGNGVVLATRADTGDVWIASWAAGTEFYAGAGQIPAGPRVFFAGALQETVPTVGRGEFNLTDSGQALFLNVVDMLLP